MSPVVPPSLIDIATKWMFKNLKGFPSRFSGTIIMLKQDGNVPSRRHILGSKIFKEQLLEKFGKKNFFQKKNFDFFSKKSIF